MALIVAKAVTKKAARTYVDVSLSTSLSYIREHNTPNPTMSASASSGSLDPSCEQFKLLPQLPISISGGSNCQPWTATKVSGVEKIVQSAANPGGNNYIFLSDCTRNEMFEGCKNRILSDEKRGKLTASCG
jgi:hypothetical protein